MEFVDCATFTTTGKWPTRLWVYRRSTPSITAVPTKLPWGAATKLRQIARARQAVRRGSFLIGKARQHQAIFPNDIHPAVRPQIHGGEPGVDLLHAQHAHHHAIEHPIFTAYGTGNRRSVFAHAQFFGGLANENARNW